VIAYWTFTEAIRHIAEDFNFAPIVRTETWQGLDASKRPELATKEQLFISFQVPIGDRSLKKLIQDIQPDLPWADDHFAERVSGTPHNPPPSEAWWPHAASNHPFKDASGKFSHTYPERMWPQWATDNVVDGDPIPHRGIRYRYGDLNDLVELLKQQPMTRQAYLPIFFPEDTGAHHGQRIPCTLGYHFIRRNDRLHVVYYIRSCDFHRHFRNDIYLTCRLLLWVLEQTQWQGVTPGNFIMHVTSLHLFVNDARVIK
jgi:hypothetical protein